MQYHLILRGLLVAIPICLLFSLQSLYAQEKHVEEDFPITESLSQEDGEEDTPHHSDKEVSILFASGIKSEIYAIYGHAAFRIVDHKTGEDKVYNWGIFDFDAPNFIGKFVQGYTTDYMLGVQETEHYIHQYTSVGAVVYETVLNLTPKEIEELEALIAENLKQPYYLYNFVYDNCSTRIFVLLEKVVDGEIHYTTMPPISRRDMVDGYATDRPWLTFGTDIVLGLPADEKIDAEEQLFLPLYAHQIIEKSTIVDTEGQERPITRHSFTYDIAPGSEQAPIASLPFFLLPFYVSLFLFIITVAVCFYRGYNARWYDIWSTIYLAVMGLVGCLVFFLSYFSLHPLVYPNYNILVFHPLHLLVSIPTLWFPRRVFGYIYHILIILSQLSFLLIVSWTTAQTFNPAVFLLSIGTIAISARFVSPYLLSLGKRLKEKPDKQPK